MPFNFHARCLRVLAACALLGMAGGAGSAPMLLPTAQAAEESSAASTVQLAQLEQLRAEFAQQLKLLQTQYEARLQALARQLEEVQGLSPDLNLAPAPLTSARPIEPAASAAPTGSTLDASPAMARASGVVAEQGLYNPEIALILQGAWRQRRASAEPELTGFAAASHGHGHDQGHSHGASERGFSLAGSELLLSANIDPLFRGHLNLLFADDEVEVEEAWFQSLALGNGLQLKGGRYLSGIGYANEQHAHSWDFADQNLMYRALFGEHLRQDGVQLKWLAPSERWLEFGAELARGQSFPGSAAGGKRNGAGSWAAFAHLGDDFNTAHSWRAGLSYLSASPKARVDHLHDLAEVETHTYFSGHSRTWLADFVWKWAAQDHGHTAGQQFKLQGELFRRKESGLLACDHNLAAGGLCSGSNSAGFRARQSGGYLQGVWQFMPAWRLGYRYDRLHAGRVDYATLPFAAPAYRPDRHSLMTDWSPSEYSRLRLQFAHDRAQQGLTDKQLTLQYIFSLGAHGAHRF